MKKNYILVLTLLISALSYGQVAGDIIITEIMQNPSAVGDNVGEYFEVYNTTGADIDMNGWTISDAGSNSFVVGSSVVVSSMGYAVFGVNGNTASNGNVTVDYVYVSGTDMSLGNSSDEIILTSAGAVEIDRVEWDNGATFPDPSGNSMNLNPSNLNGTDNSNGVNWCESTTLIAGGPGTDQGTPGAANDSCGIACELVLGLITRSCDTRAAGATDDTYTVSIPYTGGAGAASTYIITPTSGSVSGDNPDSIAAGTITITGITEGTDITVTINNLGVSGTCDFSEDIDSPNCIPNVCQPVGSVIINELMQNPSSPINDSEGEWFELYNTTGSAIDLEGWDIYDDNNPADEGFTITSSLVIPANGYLILANNGTALNGGLPTPDYIYDGTGLFLGNGADGLTVQCSGTIIDIIVWDGGTIWPDPSGASMSLDVSFNNSTDNDDGTNWSTAVFGYGPDGQLGTPGGINNMALSVTRDDIQGFAIYPNPVNNGEFSINSISNASKQVQIFDMLGKQVYSNEVQANENVTVSNLNSGIYILRVLEEGKTATRKLVIQ